MRGALRLHDLLHRSSARPGQARVGWVAVGPPAVASPQQPYIEAIGHTGGGRLLRHDLGERARRTVEEGYVTAVTAAACGEVLPALADLFQRPPYRGSNQFLPTLLGELERRGYAAARDRLACPEDDFSAEEPRMPWQEPSRNELQPHILRAREQRPEMMRCEELEVGRVTVGRNMRGALEADAAVVVEAAGLPEPREPAHPQGGSVRVICRSASGQDCSDPGRRDTMPHVCAPGCSILIT